jgi:hypothetical protein
LKGDGPPKDITIRHFGTLQTLGAFFERLPNSSNSEDWVRFIDNDEHDLYTPKIRCILRNQLDLQSIFSDDFCVEVEVLSSVRKTLDSCYETLWAYKTGYDLPSQHRDEPKDSPIESPATKVAEEEQTKCAKINTYRKPTKNPQKSQKTTGKLMTKKTALSKKT